MNNRQLFLAGTIAGLAAVMAFAALFSALGSSASAQIMQHQGMNMGAMGPGMMATTGTNQPYGGTFNSSGSSVVNNVKVTGVSITGDGEVSVALRYAGTGTSPGVVIVANTDPTAMMSLMHGPATSSGMMGMGGMGMMGGIQGMGVATSTYPAWTNTQWQAWHTQMAHQLALSNSTQWQAWHTQMMTNPVWTNSTSIPYATMQVGSTAVDAGWKNGSFKVKLEGVGSAYDSAQIMVAVFPLTS